MSPMAAGIGKTQLKIKTSWESPYRWKTPGSIYGMPVFPPPLPLQTKTVYKNVHFIFRQR